MATANRWTPHGIHSDRRVGDGHRSGDLDPAVPLGLVEDSELDPAEAVVALNHHSGLFGLAGSADMRDALAAEQAGRTNAVLRPDPTRRGLSR